MRVIKGIVHAKMGTIKDRNGNDLIEAKEIKKRWQEYTEVYKKGLRDKDNHDGVVIHLEPELPDVQAGFRKGRGTRDQIANIRWIMEKAREFQKKHLFLLY